MNVKFQSESLKGRSNVDWSVIYRWILNKCEIGEWIEQAQG
jgi:hypothetical protein